MKTRSNSRKTNNTDSVESISSTMTMRSSSRNTNNTDIVETTSSTITTQSRSEPKESLPPLPNFVDLTKNPDSAKDDFSRRQLYVPLERLDIDDLHPTTISIPDFTSPFQIPTVKTPTGDGGMADSQGSSTMTTRSNSRNIHHIDSVEPTSSTMTTQSSSRNTNDTDLMQSTSSTMTTRSSSRNTNNTDLVETTSSTITTQSRSEPKESLPPLPNFVNFTKISDSAKDDFSRRQLYVPLERLDIGDLHPTTISIPDFTSPFQIPTVKTPTGNGGMADSQGSSTMTTRSNSRNTHHIDSVEPMSSTMTTRSSSRNITHTDSVEPTSSTMTTQSSSRNTNDTDLMQSISSTMTTRSSSRNTNNTDLVEPTSSTITTQSRSEPKESLSPLSNFVDLTKISDSAKDDFSRRQLYIPLERLDIDDLHPMTISIPDFTSPFQIPTVKTPTGDGGMANSQGSATITTRNNSRNKHHIDSVEPTSSTMTTRSNSYNTNHTGSVEPTSSTMTTQSSSRNTNDTDLVDSTSSTMTTRSISRNTNDTGLLESTSSTMTTRSSSRNTNDTDLVESTSSTMTTRSSSRNTNDTDLLESTSSTMTTRSSSRNTNHTDSVELTFSTITTQSRSEPKESVLPLPNFVDLAGKDSVADHHCSISLPNDDFADVHPTAFSTPALPSSSHISRVAMQNVVPVAAVQTPRRKHAEIPRKVTWRLARIVTPRDLENQCATVFHCGPLDQLCVHCGAKFFQGERRNRQEIRLSCCKNGLYAVPPLSECPPSLRNLYTGNDTTSVQFRNQIRLINSIFAMASFKPSRPIVENRGQGHWNFSACCEIYHFTNGVPDAEDLNNPRLQHYYFLSADDALRHRQVFVDTRVNYRTLEIVETTLRHVNRYVMAYSTMGEVLREMLQSGRDVDPVTIGVMSHLNINNFLRRYNLPESRSDIAAIFDGIEPPFHVDLRLYSRSNPNHNGHHELKNLNPMADPMVYPLLFPAGDNGYCQDLFYRNHSSKRVTFKEFYRYRIQIRDGFSVLHCGGKLFQQYLVNAWVKVETNMLWWLKQNQSKFRRMEPAALLRLNQNRARGDNQTDNVDRTCLLPSAFYGGERHKQRQYLDAMAVVARHGKPDLFITFTCNPRWIEIISNLEYKQKWEHRPDLVCRVFQVKLLEFMDDIIYKQVYGVVLNYHYVIEFQKRGLPHAHILITFIDDDKLEDSQDVDSIISAVIPDQNTQPLLYQRVAEFQLHQPCGPANPRALCMKNNRCSKFYPKNYAEVTKLGAGNNGLCIYKRPRDGRTILIPETDVAVTNQHVVPYNSFALAKYACHINFEAVGSLGSVKYLYKYISKGQEFCEGVQGVNEIKRYLDNRYVNSMEAAWRLLEFRMSDRSHAVLVLPVHLQGEHITSYDELEDGSEVTKCRLAARSKLEAWFTLNRSSPEARQYKYAEIPEHYTWDGKEGKWIPRKQVAKMIGCIAEVGRLAGQMEKYYLRMLLSHVPGATSYEDLRTVDGEVFHTFEEACKRRHYLKNFEKFDQCLVEAIKLRRPKKLRGLFSLICCAAVDEERAEISRLWQQYSRYMIEDFVRGGMTVRASLLVVEEQLQNLLVQNYDVTLAKLKISVADVVECNERYYGDNSEPNNNDGDDDHSRRENRAIFDPGVLNFDQKKVFLRVVLAISRLTGIAIPEEILQSLGDAADNLSTDQQESVFYLDGAAGTGKTYLYNTLLTVVREVFGSTVAVAWTSVTASLLIGGQTAHRAFHLPFSLNNKAVAGWPLQDQNSLNFKQVALIVWDEASMTPKLAIEAVDRYLRRIHNSPKTPMGGKVVLFGGDFRQLLPVVENGNESDIIHSTLKCSRLWPEMTKLHLTNNMRANSIPLPLLGNNTFANWLLQLGEGRLPHVPLPHEKAAPLDLIDIPTCIRSPSYNDLITFVYGDDLTAEDVGSKVILCTTNVAVDKINSQILLRLPAENKIYTSMDNCRGYRDGNLYVPQEILSSINLPSLPPHELHLKVGAVVVLLRDLDLEQGLCNGIRLRVISLYEHIIECEVLVGNGAGIRLWLPRVKMTGNDSSLTFELVRFQFPVKLAFAVTINTTQVQTMTKVGVYLNRPCFAHGQLYVAFSRVGRIEQLRVFVEDGVRQGTFKYRGRRVFTRNVVFSSVLSNNVTDIFPQNFLPEHSDNSGLESNVELIDNDQESDNE